MDRVTNTDYRQFCKDGKAWQCHQCWYSCPSVRHFSGRTSFNLSLPLCVHLMGMYSQWSKNIPMENHWQCSIFSTKLSKYRVTCSKLARELTNCELRMQRFYRSFKLRLEPLHSQLTKSLQIIVYHQWFVPRFIEKCLATTGMTLTRSWHSTCLQGTTTADHIGKMTRELDPLKLKWTP